MYICNFCKIKCKNPSCELIPMGDIMSSYRTPFNLPVRYVQESGLHIENEFLFGIYENLIKERPTTTDALKRYYSSAKLREFPNHIVSSVPEKKLSHDQLTAYYVYAKNNYPVHIRLLDSYISGFKFKDQLLHPRDYFYYKLLAKSWKGFAGLPIIYLLAAISVLIPYRVTIDEKDRPDQIFRLGKLLIRAKLSGELLYYAKLRAVEQDKLLRACLKPLSMIMNVGIRLRFGSFREMFRAYFQYNEDHPIVKNL